MTTYETRTVITWLSNDEGAYGEACEIVERLGVYDGADRLQEWLEQDLEDYGLPGVLLDLLRGALSEVDWQEVAREFKPDEWGDSDEAPEDEDDDEPDAYDVYDTPAGCRGCGAVISRGEQHARNCENAD